MLQSDNGVFTGAAWQMPRSSRDDDEPGDGPPTPPADSRSVGLRSGGTLTLSATTKFMSLSPTDRKFVFDLLDRLESYEGDTPREHQSEPRDVRVAREFQRARYRTRLAKDVNPEALTLSAHRKRVLKDVHESGEAGTIARAIIERTGLPNSSVQQAARWLRDHQMIDATEDTPDGEGVNTIIPP